MNPEREYVVDNKQTGKQTQKWTKRDRVLKLYNPHLEHDESAQEAEDCSEKKNRKNILPT